MKRDVNSKLSAFLQLSESIGARLQEGTMDDAVALLHQRGDLLNKLQADTFVADLNFALAQGGAASQKTRRIIDRIMQMDKQNMEDIKRKLEHTSGMISDLANEQDAVKKMRSVSDARPKQIVDFLY